MRIIRNSFNSVILILKYLILEPCFKAAHQSKELSIIANKKLKPKDQFVQKLRSYMYGFLYAKRATFWFNLLKSAEMIEVFKYRPKLYFKPFRVYMSTKWNWNQKIKIILDTYRFINNKSDLLKQFITNEKGIDIAEMNLKNGFILSIKLLYNDKFRKEGEIVLEINCEQLGGTIAEAAFSIEEINGKNIIRIGCIQGCPSKLLNATNLFQKKLFGIRPKALLLYTIQEISKGLCIEKLYGASDSIQAYNQKQFIHIHRIHGIRFDYDAFWLESGGLLDKYGWYDLPVKFTRKDISEYPTHKRAQHRHRYEFLDKYSEQINMVIKKIIAEKTI